VPEVKAMRATSAAAVAIAAKPGRARSMRWSRSASDFFPSPRLVK
jgi:hypothetical protein